MPRTNCARRCRASGSALELFEQTGDPKYKAELEHDIAELDALIDEILLASRLDAIAALQSGRGGRPAGARGGGMRALRRLQPRRHAGDRARRSAAVAAARSATCSTTRSATARRRCEVELRREQGALSSSTSSTPGRASRRPSASACSRRSTGCGEDNAGTGLGLSLVRQIARLHGGDAVVAPRPSRPSCFRVTLPANAA